MSDETSETQREKEEKYMHHWAALCFGIVCIALGIPVWWKTTEVYRVNLPYSDIQQLSHTKIEYVTEVEVVWATGKTIDSAFFTDLVNILNDQLGKGDQPLLVSRYEVALRVATQTEVESIKKINSASELTEIAATDSLHKYSVVITAASSLISRPILAFNNNIFLPYYGADQSGVATQITQLLRDVVRESAVVRSLESAKGLKLQRPDKASMRSFRFHPGYDVTFTLMVPEPDKVKAEWDIQAGIEDYLEPLTSSLDKYINVSISSQVLYFIDITKKPKKGSNYFYYQEQDLPHIINPLESKLGSHASNNPAMNFIIYIPTVAKQPLHIHNSKDEPIPSNAFISPRWGGVLIYNTEKSNVESSGVDIDVHKVMEVFISQMRMLLNINAQMVTEDLEILHQGTASLRQWELAGWLRCRCVENLAAASLTLRSLAQLLEEISNIVINDDIGREVESAVASITLSQRLLQAGDLEAAFIASRRAIQSSEFAFFHPSLLELLYFPEDQKFAIYIPLFLPISFPVITSLLHAIRYFKKNKSLKEKTE